MRSPAPKRITERKRKERAPSSSPIDIYGTVARLREKHITELKEGKDIEFDGFAPAMKLLKGILFKADQPYRTKIALFGSLNTNSSGLLNVLYDMSSFTSVTEWSSIAVLFDQVFPHSMVIRFAPRNIASGATGSGSGVAALAAGATSALANTNLGLVAIAGFGTNAAYGSALNMLNNPNRRLAHSAKPWSYTWRNNVKFEPHGLALVTTTGGWQGWTDVSNAANIGGFVQVRGFNDATFGSGSGVVTLADVVLTFDISLRVRA